MGIFISVIILFLSMLILFFMQLPSGTFALFYHYALGKTNAKKADDKSLSFILGTEIFSATLWILVYFLTFLFSYYAINLTTIFFYIFAGIFFAEALATFLFYYRKGKSTALFIPRNLAKSIMSHAENVKNRSDCVALGAFISLFELIFTLPLYIISASVLINLDGTLRIFLIAALVLSSILPLFIIRFSFRLGHNLADIERFRVKIKPIVKLMLFFSFLALSLVAIYLGVKSNG